jgi:hypothetical protein
MSVTFKCFMGLQRNPVNAPNTWTCLRSICLLRMTEMHALLSLARALAPCIFIIINIIICWGTGLPYGLHIRTHNPPRGPSVCWWVLTTANAAGTNGLTCLPKHGGARNNKFMVTHPKTDQQCLTSAIARRSALTAGPWSYSLSVHFIVA